MAQVHADLDERLFSQKKRLGSGPLKELYVSDMAEGDSLNN